MQIIHSLNLALACFTVDFTANCFLTSGGCFHAYQRRLLSLVLAFHPKREESVLSNFFCSGSLSIGWRDIRHASRVHLEWRIALERTTSASGGSLGDQQCIKPLSGKRCQLSTAHFSKNTSTAKNKCQPPAATICPPTSTTISIPSSSTTAK